MQVRDSLKLRPIRDRVCAEASGADETTTQVETFVPSLEKLTGDEASKVVSIVADENGFEAWRHFTLRIEPAVKARTNTVLLTSHMPTWPLRTYTNKLIARLLT